MNNLKDHIDTPMLGVVAGLNLLGFKTIMSCCGFTYKNEQVPKSHLGKTYVYIKHENTTPLVLLAALSLKSGWRFDNKGPIIDWYGPGWHKGGDRANPAWNNKDAVHYYEAFVLDISSMERSLYLYRNYMADSAFIVDGNQDYKDSVSKHWQYEPAAPWTVTKEEFLQLITIPKELEGQTA